MNNEERYIQLKEEFKKNVPTRTFWQRILYFLGFLNRYGGIPGGTILKVENPALYRRLWMTILGATLVAIILWIITLLLK